MAAPRRHGPRWSDMPTPLARGGDATALRGDPLTPIGNPIESPSRHNTIPVREMDKWIRTLPPQRITHQVLSGEVMYNPALIVGQTLSILLVERVTASYVWVFTDVDYYATFPPPGGLVSVPQNLPAEALVGILKWELLFGGTSPFSTVAARMSPYAPGTPRRTSGWPWLQTPFGVQRMPSFALYASGNEEIRVDITVEDLPRFPITRLGVNMHGFAVAANLFPTAWM